MAERIEELTFDYRNEENVLVRREVDRAVLSKGAWATIMYLYQDLDRRAGTYKPAKVSIVRYRKNNGVYRKQSSFNISSEKQGRAIMEVLDRWYSTDLDKLIAAIKPAQEQASAAPAEVEAPAGTKTDVPPPIASSGAPMDHGAAEPMTHETATEPLSQEHSAPTAGLSGQSENKADSNDNEDKPSVSQPWKPGY